MINDPHTPMVFCDVCGADIDGTVLWHGDLMVCGRCKADFALAQEERDRQMPAVSWASLLVPFNVAVATILVNDSWPLVEGIAVTLAGLTGVGILLKASGRLRG